MSEFQDKINKIKNAKNKDELFDFYNSNNIKIHKELIRNRFFLDELAKNTRYEVRIEVLNYEIKTKDHKFKDLFLNDSNSSVRCIAVSYYIDPSDKESLEKYKDDRSPLIRSYLAEQGLFLDKYINDKNSTVLLRVAQKKYKLENFYNTKDPRIAFVLIDEGLEDKINISNFEDNEIVMREIAGSNPARTISNIKI